MWVGAVAWQGWINAHMLIAGPQNQSVFYRGYDPEEVVKRFRADGSDSSLSGSGAGQNTEFIRHFKHLEAHFVIASSRKTEFVTAINEQIQSELQGTSTHVVDRVEEPDGNFGYQYTTPNGGGSILVHLPVHDDLIHRNIALANGLEDIALRIELEETWNRPGSHKKVMPSLLSRSGEAKAEYPAP